MTGRTAPEWIGKTPDTAVPARVKDRIFLAHGGICHITGRKITPPADTWELDHIIALCNGGTNSEANLAPALSKPHRVKTNADVAQKAKDARIRKKHLGIETKKIALPGSKASRFKRKIGGGVVLREEC